MEADLASNVRPGAKLARLRAAAMQRGLDVELGLEDYKSLLSPGQCHYCAGALPETGHGVDRKVSALGYTLDNVVLACDPCNRIKADIFTYEQMVEIGGVLRRWRAEGRWKDPARKDGRRFGGRPLKGDLRREIEEWNRRWAAARASGDDGSGVIGEGGAAYTVQGFRPELAEELDDLSAPWMSASGRAGTRAHADWADSGAIGAERR
jgi:5-methylcytosine-specific restriction endonuclease McrA